MHASPTPGPLSVQAIPLWSRWLPRDPGWRGATVGAALSAVIVGALTGAFFLSGLGTFIDITVGLLVGMLGVGVLGTVVWVASLLLARVPRGFVVVATGALGTLIALREIDFNWPGAIFYRSAIAFVGLQALLGYAVASLFGGRLLGATTPRRVVVGAALAVALVGDVWGAVWLAGDGSSVTTPAWWAAGDLPSMLDLPNPGQPGPFEVRTLTYGSGTNGRRPEFAGAADLRTEPVDASVLLPEWGGFKARMRRSYWGFGIDAYPINGRVWFPVGEGPFPLVLIVHGNHSMEEHSDPGYGYLGQLLASRGFILVSVDENLTNATWSGDFQGREQAVRAWVLLQHLRVWESWNATLGHRFSGLVDMDNIALMGHSRGGEAVAMAAKFNRLPFHPDNASVPFGFNFSIKGVVAIAPTDYRYHRRLTVENVNYLTLHGSYDTDVESFHGLRQYHRVAFPDAGDWFKSALYIHRANHGQFNTVWGREDTGPPGSWFLNLEPLLAGQEQRTVAKVMITAFLEATLHQRREYVEAFRDPRRIRDWLPDTEYRHQFEDATFRPIADYEEDVDVTTAAVPGATVRAVNLDVWREGALPLRGDDDQLNNAVYLGWANGDASYGVELPSGYRLPAAVGSEPVLVMSLSAGGETDRPATEGPLDFTVELEDRSGRVALVAVSRYAPVPPPLRTPRLLKTDDLSREVYGEVWEPILQTFAFPLRWFTAAQPSFDPTTIRVIRFRFDRSPEGTVIIDDIGFRRGA